MHRASCLLLSLLFLPLIPGVHAVPSDAVRLLEDAADDITIQYTAPAPPTQGSMDLRYLDIQETETSVLFTLGTGPNNGHHDQSEAFIGFQHGDAEYRLNLEQRNLVGGWWWVSILERVEPDGGFSFVSQSQVSTPLAADGQAGWVRAEVPRSDLTDRQGVLPFAGRSLENIWVESRGFSVDAQLRDRMPDEGVAPEPYVFQVGPRQRGDVELWSTSPSRASNGEATALIFEVTALNKGSGDLDLRFGAEDVPQGWQVTFPTPLVKLGGGESAVFPVLVQMPFNHVHGATSTVDVTLQSDDDAHEGRTTLSVIYHAVPQPAGHHDTVWFHSDASPDGLTPAIHASGFDVWHGISMNALEEFNADDGVAVPARNGDGYHYWTVPLDPVLQMGLDFDLEDVGTILVPFQSTRPVPDAVLYGEIYVRWQDDAGQFQTLTVADVGPSDAMGINGETLLEAPVTARPEGDLVPYREGANLVLDLRMDRSDAFVGTGPEKPELLSGGWMQLPLNEYHDPVDDIFRSLQGVSLEAAGPQQRPVNPGETVTFQAGLGYDGPEVTFDLRLDGVHADQARVLEGPTVRVGGGTTATLTVAVAAPLDASDGTFLDTVLVATKADEPAVQGLLRLVAEVDTDADHVRGGGRRQRGGAGAGPRGRHRAPGRGGPGDAEGRTGPTGSPLSTRTGHGPFTVRYGPLHRGMPGE